MIAPPPSPQVIYRQTRTPGFSSDPHPHVIATQVARQAFEDVGGYYLDIRNLSVMYKTGYPGTYQQDVSRLECGDRQTSLSTSKEGQERVQAFVCLSLSGTLRGTIWLCGAGYPASTRRIQTRWLYSDHGGLTRPSVSTPNPDLTPTPNSTPTNSTKSLPEP